MRLISNVERDTSCRELFKTLNTLLVPYMYIMVIVYYVKLNIRWLEQNLKIIAEDFRDKY
jgi:hypothetical protein